MPYSEKMFIHIHSIWSFFIENWTKWNPITTLDLKVLYCIIVFSKKSDLYLSFEWLNIFVGHLEVTFLSSELGHFYQFLEFPHFEQYQLNSAWSQILNFFFAELKIQTSNIPSKMFGSLKNRYWPKFLENTMKCTKLLILGWLLGLQKVDS